MRTCGTCTAALHPAHNTAVAECADCFKLRMLTVVLMKNNPTIKKNKLLGIEDLQNIKEEKVWCGVWCVVSRTSRLSRKRRCACAACIDVWFC